MPEVPEVETLVRGLRRKITGRLIQAVRLGKTDFMDNPAEMERDLPGSAIRGIQRHGKFFTLSLENGAAPGKRLCVHLGMTGQKIKQENNGKYPFADCFHGRIV